MEVEFELTKNDLVESNLYFLPDSLKAPRSKFGWLSCAIIFILGGIALIFSKDMSLGVAFLIIGFFLLYVFWYNYKPQILRKRVTKLIEEQNDIVPNDDICRHKVSISNDGLTDSTDYDRITAFWPGIREIKESEKYLYIFQTKAKAFIVPKRAFPDEASFNQFTQAARDFHAKALSDKPKS